MITTLQLSYFLAAARYGTLSAAAEALHVAQPSVSDQVAKLERHLGVVLFVRGNRGLRLTSAGDALLPFAERVLGEVDEVDEAEDAVRQVRELTAGSIEFGTFSSAHHYLLVDLLSEFKRLHPRVRLKIVGRNSSEVAEAVRSGELEAGLVALPVDDRGLSIGDQVWSCEVVYLHVDEELTRGPVGIETILSRPLILPEAGAGDADPTRHRLTLAAQKSGRTLSPDIEVESHAAALELAARGLGGTIAPLPLARVLGYEGRLSSGSLDMRMEENFAFVTRKKPHLSTAVRALIDVATTLLRQLQDTHRHSVLENLVGGDLGEQGRVDGYQP